MTVFLRLLPYDDKAAALTEAVAAVREGRTLNPVVHAVDPARFAKSLARRLPIGSASAFGGCSLSCRHLRVMEG